MNSFLEKMSRWSNTHHSHSTHGSNNRPFLASHSTPLGPLNRIAHSIDPHVPNLEIELYTENHTGSNQNGRYPFVFQTPYAVTLPQSVSPVPAPYPHDEMWKPNLPRNSRVNGFKTHTHLD